MNEARKLAEHILDAHKDTDEFLKWCDSGRVPKKYAIFCAGWIYTKLCEYRSK